MLSRPELDELQEWVQFYEKHEYSHVALPRETFEKLVEAAERDYAVRHEASDGLRLPHGGADGADFGSGGLGAPRVDDAELQEETGDKP